MGQGEETEGEHGVCSAPLIADPSAPVGGIRSRLD